MRNTIFVTAAALVILAACEQKTETQTTTNATGTVQTRTTEVTTTVPPMTVDTAATAEAKEKLKVAGEKAKVMATDAAHATGTALESAGKKIEEKTDSAKSH